MSMGVSSLSVSASSSPSDNKEMTAFHDAAHEKGTGVLDSTDVDRAESLVNGETQPIDASLGPNTVKRKIKSRHAQMTALAGAIGTSFFLAIGQALVASGPALLFLAYVLTSVLVYGMVTSIIEMGTFLPIPGASMNYFAKRFVSPSLGFAMGWMYFYSFGVVVAYELTASSILISYWPNNVNIAVWITVFGVVIIGLNLCPVGIYAETEFWFASLKVIMILGLLIVSLVLMLGGGPDHHRLGFHYWKDPGAVREYLAKGAGGRFTGFLYVWVFSVFSFNFTPEQIVAQSGEMQRPRKNLPTAARRFFWRMIVFYMIGTLAVGAICSSTAPGLTTGAGNANASPWVIGIQNAGIRVLPSVINAGMLASAWSAGNAYLYMASRTLYSLARAGDAPQIFTRCNRYGLPLYAVLASSLFAPLAYMNCAQQAGVVFNWFINITNTGGYTSWICCCVIYMRFRKATTVQGVQVPWRSRLQPWMSYVCLFLFSFLLLCNGFTVFYPGQFTASKFITAYIGIAAIVVIYVAHKIVAGRSDPWWRPADKVDLVTGIDEVEAHEAAWRQYAEAQAEANNDSAGKNVLRKIWNKVKLVMA
ncbi:proline permease PrnB [Niveomyces insectorum RCEF 264]|uniref:Proline permease PrnB n=1 Tax=Niveomyces insectorum RCEF 264 TaxID=1081102 RepID=A0A167S367_9HYPO|nr:proline permease PrnB [Niveomyces insectorum RCEF 264]